MILIERPIGADRETDAVERQPVLLANGREIPVRRAARAHLVFGVNFEESDVGFLLEDRAVMLSLQPDAPARGDAVSRARRRKRHGNLQSERSGQAAACPPTPLNQAFLGVRLPGPLGISM